jgi:hypothetical protein
MTITLNLPPEMELYLIREAEKKGVSVEDYILEILAEHIFKDAKS